MLQKKSLGPLFILFVVVNTLAVIYRRKLEAWGYDTDVLLAGNLLLCVITAISFSMLYKGMRSATTPRFLRSVYGSFLMKFFFFGACTLGYVAYRKSDLNKASLFTCMFLYLIYTFIEIRSLMKIFNSRKDA
jgi:hypothetical protein